MKTSELTGATLGKWVTRAEDRKYMRGERRHPIPVYQMGDAREDGLAVHSEYWFPDASCFTPKDGKELARGEDQWGAYATSAAGICYAKGPTALIAAARATVMTEFGEEVSDASSLHADLKV